MLGYRCVPVTQHPSLVEVGGFLLTYLLGDLVEGFGPPGGHGKGDGNLLFGQLVSVQRIYAAGVGIWPGV
jgi:hypothetical protein